MHFVVFHVSHTRIENFVALYIMYTQRCLRKLKTEDAWQYLQSIKPAPRDKVSEGKAGSLLEAC